MHPFFSGRDLTTSVGQVIATGLKQSMDAQGDEEKERTEVFRI